jgi:hypothetical protein
MSRDSLVTALQMSGSASLEVTEDRPVHDCREQLIGAAQEIDVRISMKRHTDGHERVVATVLTEEEAERQIERDAIFRSVNRIRTGINILESGEVDTRPINDEVLDLIDIADELETYAREISSGG